MPKLRRRRDLHSPQTQREKLLGRAIVSIDGVKKPLELDNFRSRSTVKKDGKVVPFGEKDPGQFIGSFFNKK